MILLVLSNNKLRYSYIILLLIIFRLKIYEILHILIDYFFSFKQDE